MSDAWLVLVTAGLCLDVCGVIILAGPLLRFNKKNYQLNEDKFLEYEASYLSNITRMNELFNKPYKAVEIKHLSDYVLTQFSELRYNFIAIMRMNTRTKLNIYNESRISLSIITIGFLLQIIGNWIK